MRTALTAFKPMKRLLVCVFAMALVAALFAAVRSAAAPAAYSVAQVSAGIARSQKAWLGRTILVRGTARPASVGSVCINSTTCPFGDLLFDGNAVEPSLWLEPRADPLLGQLRRVPLVGQLLPGPQRLRYYWPAVYRVQIVSRPCPPLRCLVADLLDAP